MVTVRRSKRRNVSFVSTECAVNVLRSTYKNVSLCLEVSKIPWRTAYSGYRRLIWFSWRKLERLQWNAKVTKVGAMCLDNRVDTPMTIRIVTSRPNCFHIYEVNDFDVKVQWYFGLFDFVRFIHEDRKQFATPLPRTWETDVSCDWSKICYRNHLPIISHSSKRYRIA